MATQANLIATYQSNPTLQNRYTQQEYLDMFGFGAQQPTPTPDPDPTPTPPSDGIQNIIGQNLNQINLNTVVEYTDFVKSDLNYMLLLNLLVLPLVICSLYPR